MGAPARFAAASMALGLGLVATGARAEDGVEITPAPSPNVVIVETPAAQPSPPVVVVQQPVLRAPEQPEREIWYGGQTLLVDAASAGTFVGAVAMGNRSARVAGGLAVAGTLTFLFGPPIVHFAHDRIGPGFGSFALRLALPLEAGFDGLLIGGAMTSHQGSEDIPSGVVYGSLIGLAVGAVAASAIDAALLARYKSRDVDPEAYDPNTDAASDAAKKDARRADPLEVHWAPTAAPVLGGATLGVGGVF